MLMIRRIVGDSMLPGLYPGTLVFGVRWPKRLRVGRVVILRHNGVEKIKRLTRLDHQQVYVEGDNPGFSTDSRQFGWLDEAAVKAVVVWPRSKPGA